VTTNPGPPPRSVFFISFFFDYSVLLFELLALILPFFSYPPPCGGESSYPSLDQAPFTPPPFQEIVVPGLPLFFFPFQRIRHSSTICLFSGWPPGRHLFSLHKNFPQPLTLPSMFLPSPENLLPFYLPTEEKVRRVPRTSQVFLSIRWSQ